MDLLLDFINIRRWVSWCPWESIISLSLRGLHIFFLRGFLVLAVVARDPNGQEREALAKSCFSFNTETRR
jgi:hypothetical protein